MQIAAMVPKAEKTLRNFAEIYVYEPFLLSDQSTEWRLVTEHHLDRQYFASDTSAAELIHLFGTMSDDEDAEHPNTESSGSDDRGQYIGTEPESESSLRRPGRPGGDPDNAGTPNSNQNGDS